MWLVSFNVNGIRAAGRKGLWDWLDSSRPAVVCLQEIKASDQVMQDLFGQRAGLYGESLGSPAAQLGYQAVWHSALKPGYSGTMILYQPEVFTAVKTVSGLKNAKFDQEGRLTRLETERFVLLNGYFPQGGRGPERIAYKLEFYEEVLKLVSCYQAQKMPVIVCGDFNTTFSDLDLARPKENRNNTGCLPEERAALAKFKLLGLVDSFRYFHPDLADQYSYWDQITRARERNVGWRIDYFLVDQALLAKLAEAKIFSEIKGSDHCPVAIRLLD